MNPKHRTASNIARLLASAGLLAAGGCKTLQLAGEWASTAVEADGRTVEWDPVAADRSLNKDNVQLAARNDAGRLFLMFRFRTDTDKWARPCAMTGLSLWLDAGGKKSRDTGLRLVAGPEPGTAMPEGDRPAGGRGEGRPGGTMPDRERRPREHDGMLVVVDRKADRTAVLPPDGTHGPAAGFTCADGLCTYEFSIPLAGDSGEFVLDARPGSSIMVGLTAGPSEEERAAMPERTSGAPGGGSAGGRGGPPGGASGGPPGGRGGPPGGGGPGSADASPELWVKVSLAGEPEETEE